MSDEQTTMPEERDEMTAEEQHDAPTEVRAEDAMQYAVHIFAELAWVNLGIQQNRMTGEVKTDLAQARLAIDAIGALVPLLEGRIDPHNMRDLHNLLSTLQLNYVQRAAK